MGWPLLTVGTDSTAANVPLPIAPLMPAPDTDRAAPSWARGWVRGLGLLLGLMAIGLILDHAPPLDAGLMNRLARDANLHGVAVYLGLGSALCAVGVPRQTIAFAAGYAFAPRFGLGIAVLLSLATQLAGCVADFAWARWVGGSWVRDRLPPRLRRLDLRLSEQPFRATLVLRLLPVGNNIALNLLGGVSAIRLAPFLAASAIGYLPQTVIFVLLGRGSHVGAWAEIGVAVALLAGSGVLAVRLIARRPDGSGLSEG